MFIIVGLGNPTSEYEGTRHNVGFEVIDAIAEKYNIEVDTKKHRALIGKGMIAGQKVILAKPQTYMNLSGEAVIEFMNFYKLSEEDLIVVYDDIDIEPGKIRIRRSGSASTHNGMKSIVHYLNTQNFERVRVGIGKPEFNGDLISYVIGDIPTEEKELLSEGVSKAEEAIETILKDGIETAMNLYN